MTEKKTTTGQWVSLAISLAVILAVKLLPPPAGLPETGFQILGILVAAIALFLTWGVGWTSMLVVAMMMTVPGLTVAQVTQATFGNNTAVFLLICFMLAACLTTSGAARRIATWFLTNRLARRNPWWTIAMYFAAVFLLDLFLSSATCIMIFLPILLSIFESVGLEKEKDISLASMMLLCTVTVACLSNGTNPISHAVTIQGFSLYESYVGEPMDFLGFSLVTLPVALVSILVIFALVRLVWRPDVSSFTRIDYDALKASCGPVTKREKWSVFFYLFTVVLWLLPGLGKYLFPAAASALSKINNIYPPLLALFLMHLIRVDGERILDWQTALGAVNWPTFLFIASIMGLGSFMGNEKAGISQWLSDTLAPLFSGVPPIIFVLIVVVLVNVMTNFCSNAVALSVVFALAMPICMVLYDGLISPAVVAVLLTSSAQNGWATPPATPTAAVAYSAGWSDHRLVLRWGMVFMVVQIIACMLIGVPLAQNLL